MKSVDGQNARSQLLRRLAGAFDVPLFFWALAVGLGCAVFLLAASLYPLWMQVKPRSSTVAQPLLNTPLESLAPWVAFLLLYVPDMLLLFASGLFAGWCVRRKWVRWITTCLGTYAILSVAFGGSIWQRAVVAAFQVNLLDWGYGVLCLVIVSTAYAGALLAIRLSSPDHPSGFCPNCGYSLYGLPSAVCPECGRPFSPSEGELDADGESKAPDNLSIERTPEPLRRVWTAKPVLLARVSVMALLVGAFYAWDWMPLRNLQRNTVGWSLQLCGYDPKSLTHAGSPAIRVGEQTIFYTAECTYLDLLLIVAPFLWVFNANRGRNLRRMGLATMIILGGNLIRSWASAYFNMQGIDWFYAHDLPDYIIWWPTVVVVVLLALRRDLGRPSPAVRKPPPVAAIFETCDVSP